ncbi:transposase [Streptomyces ambofaciens ATCC 23877]|uniref:Transposase n=1 Tax=Streptomyces ambofaciens (strain ATCC 23877 / 3486 / DSM 40053 / JCM 4204 / NBRC 12836 / NRRL B-2516) TaxID=278992 RepID=Q1RRC3_STRA7|nr:transposase [Streptomyces ambofaciens ATCC 23877]CAI78165.1 putative transposase [Streptomyces ambofaciens ATCC 23877]CAJ89223.1 putative transposase [Streptomyces ambofaciens ATCC 23877]
MGRQAIAVLRQLDAACTSVDDVTQATEESADAKGLKAFAGAAPVTRASGKHLAVMARRVKNQRLASVGYARAFASLTASPGARDHYDRRRAHGDRHTAAQRNLFNRILGCLHHRLTKRTVYDENKAIPPSGTLALRTAA